MGILGATVLYLILLHTSRTTTAKDDEWKSATATYSKETDGSIITEGACGYGDLHKTSYGKYSAGLSTMLFNRGSTCGGCFELRCVDHILWCLQGSPPIVLTATDFCPPNFGLPSDYGGWCNFPREHFEMSEAAFALHSSAIILALPRYRCFMSRMFFQDSLLHIPSGQCCFQAITRLRNC